MSYALQDAVWKLRGIRGPAKLVLLRLAHYPDDATEAAYPSVKTLAEWCGLSPRTVVSCLHELEDAGLIRAAGGRSLGGVKKTNRWLLVLETMQDLQSSEPETLQKTSDNPAAFAEDSINDSIKEDGGDARAAPEVLTPIQQVVEAFDAARTSAFGPRARQHPGDAATAKQFLDKISLPDLIALISRDMPTANPGNPPATLAYFRDSVDRFVADRKAPGKDRSNVKRHPTADRGNHDSSAVKIGCDIARAFVEGRMARV